MIDLKTTDELLNAELRRDEGVRYSPYLDTEGVRTVGVGHNMQAKPIPSHWRFPLTDAQVNQLLSEDLAEVFAALDRRMNWWRNLTYARQRVLCNMAFNMGIDGLMGFKTTLAHVISGRYKDASVSMLKSKWATQVGDRAKRLSKMMKEG